MRKLFITAMLVAMLSIATALPVSEDSTTESENSRDYEVLLAANCDCDDEEALCHKTLRQIIDKEGLEGMTNFLKNIRARGVCGSDGNFYKTNCQLLCERVRNPEKGDLLERKPRFCRWRSRLHASKSSRKEQKLVKRQKRHHQHNHSPTRICICPRHFAPVCASNGVTYGNKCAFNCAKENLNPDIVIIGQHKCDESPHNI